MPLLLLRRCRSPWLLLAIPSSSSRQISDLQIRNPYSGSHFRRSSSSSSLSPSYLQQHEDDDSGFSPPPPRPLTLSELGLDDDDDYIGHGSLHSSLPADRSYCNAEENGHFTSRSKPESYRRSQPQLSYGNEEEQEDNVRLKQRNRRFQSPMASISSAPERKPKPEEMKQAALDAAGILAGIAGIKLSSSPSQRIVQNSKIMKIKASTQEQRNDDEVSSKEGTKNISFTLASQTYEDHEASSLEMLIEDHGEEEKALETFSEDDLEEEKGGEEEEEEEEEFFDRSLGTLSEDDVELGEEEASSDVDVSGQSSDISATHTEKMVLEEDLHSSAPKFSHPWPEWIEFLEKLYAKGFFKGTEEFIEDGKHLFDSYTAVRHAACVFARERTDIFRSLKRKDLRTLGNCSCPDLERKTSNASKRLRDHFNIPEGEVCMNCKLKMSCSRAFLTPSQALAVTTLDVLRVITGFATSVGTSVSDVGERNECPSEVQTSVCRLLREFLTLCELPKGEESPVESHLQSRKAKKERQKTISSFSVPDKPGDWVCPNCDFMNFNRNRRCKECHVCRPPQDQEVLLGDWTCSKCWYLNFSKNSFCRECKTERPTKTKWAGGEEVHDEDVFNNLNNEKKPTSGEFSIGYQRQKLESSRVKTNDSEADDRILTKQKDKNMKNGKSFDKLEASEARGIARKMDKNRDKSTRRENQFEKHAEKDYEASEEDEGLLNESLCSSITHHSESEINLIDEENRALMHGSKRIPSKKVPQVLFNWSDDDNDEEKSSRALSKKVKPSKPKGKAIKVKPSKHKKVKY